MKRIIAIMCALFMLFGCIAETLPTQAPVEADAETAQGCLSGIVIGIDPGHQAHGNSGKEYVSPKKNEKKAKVSSGTSGYKTRVPEYQTVLDISLVLKEVLEAEGATVVMTRDTNDIDISNYERAQLMNEAGCDLVLRIHCDGADSHSTSGIGLFVRKSILYGKDIVPDRETLLTAERAAADAIIARMCEYTGAKNRGVRLSDTYTMNNWSTVPIILVECGFMSNAEEDRRLNDPDYQRTLAEGMRDGIRDWLGR